MPSFDFQPTTETVFGNGAVSRIGEFARRLGFSHSMIVADRGIAAAGYVARVTDSLQTAGISSVVFHDFEANPDSVMVEAGRAFAAAQAIDSIVALGGGSSLDCAKGINFVLTNGGTMRDFRGYGKAVRPMLPMIGIPTTAGTGSEAQSYAIISDAATHEKMACGDPGAAFKVSLLDPELTVTQPRSLTAIAGYDAIAHAVESFVTTKRTAGSDACAIEAWQLLNTHYERVLAQPGDLDARGAMLTGANRAGAAIERSMLGATHACANPLTAKYGTTHGIAIAVMLPHVVRWNQAHVGTRYAQLVGHATLDARDAGEQLAQHLHRLARAGDLPSRLRELGAAPGDIGELAEEAGHQWTGTFNPRPFDAAAARYLYELDY